MKGGYLTTHVLDTAVGKPAAGLCVELYRFTESGDAAMVAAGTTNGDGRLDRPLLEGTTFRSGLYEIRFDVGAYFQTQPHNPASMWRIVKVAFAVEDENGHYHVPLLIAPGGYSTYRGS